MKGERMNFWLTKRYLRMAKLMMRWLLEEIDTTLVSVLTEFQRHSLRSAIRADHVLSDINVTDGVLNAKFVPVEDILNNPRTEVVVSIETNDQGDIVIETQSFKDSLRSPI